jgi:hypothetical protein
MKSNRIQFVYVDLISTESMEFVANAQLELHTIKKNKFVIPCVPNKMKSLMERLVFALQALTESMEPVANALQEPAIIS